MMFGNRDDYIGWYESHYGHKPEQYLLEKYYPKAREEKPIEVSPVPEEFWRESALDG